MNNDDTTSDDATDTTQTSDKPASRECDLKTEITRLHAVRLRLALTPEGVETMRLALELSAAKYEAEVAFHVNGHKWDDGEITEAEFQVFVDELNDVNARTAAQIEVEKAFYADIDQEIAFAEQRLRELHEADFVNRLSSRGVTVISFDQLGALLGH